MCNIISKCKIQMFIFTLKYVELRVKQNNKPYKNNTNICILNIQNGLLYCKVFLLISSVIFIIDYVNYCV